jgi:hypothetical protein
MRKRYRTAPICGRAAQSARAFESFSNANSHSWPIGLESDSVIFIQDYNRLDVSSALNQLPAAAIIGVLSIS